MACLNINTALTDIGANLSLRLWIKTFRVGRARAAEGPEWLWPRRAAGLPCTAGRWQVWPGDHRTTGEARHLRSEPAPKSAHIATEICHTLVSVINDFVAAFACLTVGNILLTSVISRYLMAKFKRSLITGVCWHAHGFTTVTLNVGFHLSNINLSRQHQTRTESLLDVYNHRISVPIQYT